MLTNHILCHPREKVPRLFIFKFSSRTPLANFLINAMNSITYASHEKIDWIHKRQQQLLAFIQSF